MTRLTLAEAVNDHVFRATGTPGAVDAHQVGRWERGVTRWPVARVPSCAPRHSQRRD